METDRSATVLNYVAAGCGVTIFPAQVAHFAVPGVVFRALKGKVPAYEYGLAWRAENLNPALTQIIEMVRMRSKLR